MQDTNTDRLWSMYVLEAVGSFIILMVIQHAHIFEFSAFAISVGFILAVVVAAKISGAHLNGAVTITLALNQMRTEKVPYQNGDKIYKYILAQVIGGTAAGLFTALVHGPETLAHIQHNVSISLSQAFFLEFIYTLVLCTVVSILCSDAYKHVHDPNIIGFLVGGSVFLASMALGDKTGGVINPSVALSAVLARGMTTGSSEELQTVWLYVLAPCCGGFIAHMMYDKLIRPALLKTLPDEQKDLLLNQMHV